MKKARDEVKTSDRVIERGRLCEKDRGSERVANNEVRERVRK